MKKLFIMLLVVFFCFPQFVCGAETYVPGFYRGVGQGFGGSVSVEIEVDADKIIGITAIGEGETDAIGGQALESLTQSSLASQSVDVEVVAGATMTSSAVKEAAKAALAPAQQGSH